MKNVGFIGTGSMGSLLIDALINSKYISANNVHVTNRSLHKAKKLQERHHHLNIHDQIASVAKSSDWIFICVKPHEMISAIEELSSHLKMNHVIITITSPLQVEDTEQVLSETNTPIARFIPSIVNLSLDGPSLVTYSDRCSQDLQQELWAMFSSISRPSLIDASITRAASDIGCCGPAFISFFVEQMIKGAVEETTIDEETATRIAESMLIGYGEVLKQKHFTLSTLRDRVTVPGGVTGVALNVLQAEVGFMFNHLFQETEKKYQNDRRSIEDQLKGS